MLLMVLVHHCNFSRLCVGKHHKSYLMIASFTVPKSLHISTDKEKLKSTQTSLVIAFGVSSNRSSTLFYHWFLESLSKSKVSKQRNLRNKLKCRNSNIVMTSLKWKDSRKWTKTRKSWENQNEINKVIINYCFCPIWFYPLRFGVLRFYVSQSLSDVPLRTVQNVFQVRVDQFQDLKTTSKILVFASLMWSWHVWL